MLAPDPGRPKNVRAAFTETSPAARRTGLCCALLVRRRYNCDAGPHRSTRRRGARRHERASAGPTSDQIHRYPSGRLMVSGRLAPPCLLPSWLLSVCGPSDVLGSPVWIERSLRSVLTGICRPVDPFPIRLMEGTWSMVTFGVDAHKRTHTIVAVDDRGRSLGQTDDRHHQQRSSRPGPVGGQIRRGAPLSGRRLPTLVSPVGARPVGRRRTGRAGAAQADGTRA